MRLELGVEPVGERVDVVALDLGECARDERDQLGRWATGFSAKERTTFSAASSLPITTSSVKSLVVASAMGSLKWRIASTLPRKRAALRGVEHRQVARSTPCSARTAPSDGGVLERVDDAGALLGADGRGRSGRGAVDVAAACALVEADDCVQVARELHEPLVAGVGVLALLVHVDERPALLGGEVAVATACDEQVGALLGEEAADDGW